MNCRALAKICATIRAAHADGDHPALHHRQRPHVSFGAVWQALRYLATGRGFTSIPSGPVLAFVRSQPHLETPDLQVHFVFTIADLKRRKLGKTPGITASIYQLLPESRIDPHQKHRPDRAAGDPLQLLSDAWTAKC